MNTYDIQHAKAQFARLIDVVSRGQEIVITKAGRPLAKLVPIASPPIDSFQRKPGSLKGKIQIADDFDAPLPPDILAAFRSA